MGGGSNVGQYTRREREYRNGITKEGKKDKKKKSEWEQKRKKTARERRKGSTGRKN